jgi:hypothetical protein
MRRSTIDPLDVRSRSLTVLPPWQEIVLVAGLGALQVVKRQVSTVRHERSVEALQGGTKVHEISGGFEAGQRDATAL